MPYISPDARLRLLSEDDPKPTTPGEVNFLITEIILGYTASSRPSYTEYATLVGILETCKMELYRRLVVPYENNKIAQHGDVYDGAAP